MTVECGFTELDGDWWFCLGISYNTTKYYKYRHCLAFEFIFWYIFVRW